MADAYRTSGFRCPSCNDSPLREFNGRLVCDECAGMLIEDVDFAASIHELDGGDAPLAVTDEKPSATPCPRCNHEMSSCALSIGKLHLRGSFMRCARDGVWFPRDAMTAAFARASRGAHHGVGVGRTYGGTTVSGTTGMPGGGGGFTDALRGIQNAFGSGRPASASLAISNWESSRPRVHTLFVSAHKDKTLGCPACKEAKLQYQGDLWACAACAGCFVETAALEAMVQDMTNAPWAAPPPVAGAGSDRPCPLCASLMTVEVLEAVTIDRCAPHGVWFDANELQSALHHASEPKSAGVGSWVKRLFHRHGQPE